jgi:DNA-binding IscR family transcriptional regulator
VLAVEGSEPAFRCTEIRRRGPSPASARMLKNPCAINVAMLRAEKAYRAELERISIADIVADVAAHDDGSIARRGCAFIAVNERRS